MLILFRARHVKHLVVQARRRFAVETKTRFQEPPSPPQSSSSNVSKLVIILGLGGVLIGVAMWPEKNYGIDTPPPPPGSDK